MTQLPNWRKIAITALLTASGSKILTRLQEIERLDKLPKARAKAYQTIQLKKLLLSAYAHVPYYREVLPQAGVIDAQGRVQLKNFKNIPPLTRDDIRTQGDRLYSRWHRMRLSYRNSTSGSTGEPVQFIQDRFYHEWNVANKIFYKRRFGHDIGEKELRLWGSSDEYIHKFSHPLKHLTDWLYNRKDLNTFRLNHNDVQQVLQTWRDFKPQWIEAYVHSLQELMTVLQREGSTLPSPKAIVSTAGTLDPELAHELQSALQAPILNRYGSREVGDMACTDLNAQGLSLSYWNHVVEILDDTNTAVQPGQVGSVYVTPLRNYSMPLIRYEIGDMAIPSSNWRYLESVEGKRSTFFTNARGERINVGFLRMMMYQASWVTKYQIIQKSLSRLVYKIVVAPGYTVTAADRERITAHAQVMMGKNCTIEIEIVDEIHPLTSGKFLFTISEIE